VSKIKRANEANKQNIDLLAGLNPKGDPDYDGISNQLEQKKGTNPLVADLPRIKATLMPNIKTTLELSAGHHTGPTKWIQSLDINDDLANTGTLKRYLTQKSYLYLITKNTKYLLHLGLRLSQGLAIELSRVDLERARLEIFKNTRIPEEKSGRFDFSMTVAMEDNHHFEKVGDIYYQVGLINRNDFDKIELNYLFCC